MARTTPPKEDKAATSSVETPMAQALAARLGNKVLDDTLAYDNLGLLNFDAVESKILCWISSQL
jgi:hypothetical protein